MSQVKCWQLILVIFCGDPAKESAASEVRRMNPDTAETCLFNDKTFSDKAGVVFLGEAVY